MSGFVDNDGSGYNHPGLPFVVLVVDVLIGHYCIAPTLLSTLLVVEERERERDLKGRFLE